MEGATGVRGGLLTACVVLGLAAPICGCGRVGLLDQPAPLYGEKAKAEYQARKAAAAQAAAQHRETGEPEALPARPAASPMMPVLPPGAAPPPHPSAIIPLDPSVPPPDQAPTPHASPDSTLPPGSSPT